MASSPLMITFKKHPMFGRTGCPRPNLAMTSLTSSTCRTAARHGPGAEILQRSLLAPRLPGVLRPGCAPMPALDRRAKLTGLGVLAGWCQNRPECFHDLCQPHGDRLQYPVFGRVRTVSQAQGDQCG